ncbi:MAG TPA: hypothetical protein VEP90_24010 [Methylomirabilota bacterium]|nr:hypothetical protein [Methylomirabilota bacterium]
MTNKTKKQRMMMPQAGTKKLRQIAIKNPSLDYIKPKQEKKWAGSQSGQKTNAAPYVAPQFNKDDADAEEKHFKGVKGASPRPGKSVPPDQGPKDSYGDGNYFLNMTKAGKQVVPEETIDEIRYSNPDNRYAIIRDQKRAIEQHHKKQYQKSLRQVAKKVKSGAQSSEDEKNEDFTKASTHHSLKAQPLSTSGQGKHKYPRDTQQGVIKLPKQGTTTGKFAPNSASRMPPPKTGNPGTKIKDPLKNEGQHSFPKGGDLAPHHLGGDGRTKVKSPSAPSDIGNTTATTAVDKGGKVNKFEKAAYLKTQTWGTDKTKKPAYDNPNSPSTGAHGHSFGKVKMAVTRLGVPIDSPNAPGGKGHSYGDVKNPTPSFTMTKIDHPNAPGGKGHSYGDVKNPTPKLGNTGTKVHSPNEEKEEIELEDNKEQINELSPEKLGAYVAKARANRTDNLANKKKFRNRTIGIQKAQHLQKSE